MIPANPDPPTLWLTTRETAALLNVSERCLYTLAKDGALPRVTLPGGRGIRYRRRDVERFSEAYGTAV